MSDLRPPRARRPPTEEHPFPHSEGSRGNVQFSYNERGDRTAPLRNQYDAEAATTNVSRKKSLVRPDREKIEPGHRQWYYRQAAAGDGSGDNFGVGVFPSTTGNYPRASGLRRGKSLLGREEDVQESGLALFKRGATLRRKRSGVNALPDSTPAEPRRNRACFREVPGPTGPWTRYCYFITLCIPNFMLKACGLRSLEQQRAWREKMGLLSIILLLMAGVGYLTFGFTKSVCGRPPNRYPNGEIDTGSVIIHGYDYDLGRWNHPRTGMFDGNSNPLYTGNWNAAGNDISFLFQTVNENCLGLITKASSSSISGSGENLDWYFPCNIFNQHGTSGINLTNYEHDTSCHTSTSARNLLTEMHPQGQVFYSWDDVRSERRNLAVYEQQVLDLNLLNWLSPAQVNYPSAFDEMKTPNGTFNGKDLSMYIERSNQKQLGHCLQDLVTVGFIDTNTIGCVASTVVLYVSLVFIIGVVAIRFAMAVLFAWFFSWKLGNFPRETYEDRMRRSEQIEAWSNDIYRPAPSHYRPNVSKKGLTKGVRRTFLPSHSRFTPSDNVSKARPATAYGMLSDTSSYSKRGTMYSGKTPPDSPGGYNRKSRATTVYSGPDSFSKGSLAENPCPFPLHNVVPQPPPDSEPWNFPLAHTICLVTAYSESVEGLRTTLDSLATSDYPNSHKLLLVIADGMVKGSGNDLTTPEICLTMMKDMLVPPEEVEAHSYVAIADGHKRHNMAKVFAGFYDYDDATIERSKQQRVPFICVAKVGNAMERDDPKPGNRGKRDSQIVLMSFLQKVMFDERMTTFEYEFFNAIWRVTGISPDRYELALCVDADTKIFPDSLTRMVSSCVCDPEIMGLCGETKIANKGDTFVTMMQVFEYYISHHMTKAFESMFGGVTCLPGCFSMYRIKAPKGDSGYWVPILANPDIVEHYSENVVDTLHKKNLLLLGEDRYLTTLLLKTFPKRKNMFCPQAVCKTVVPDTFRVLLSQRRRWINSTIHNLAELLLVRDLCGTFCFSMQFVVGMELAGTLVLPAAISFTLYLIIDSAIPGGTDNTIPLILLAIVLGLPGILIVITSRKVAYVWWMLVYLVSLPVWNGVLPAYAFWHFDDFSWGQTRKVTGEIKRANHGDKEGEFDSSHIVMKKWAEFERERRLRNGTHSRDSERYDSNRYSMASNSDTFHPPSNAFDASTLDSSSYAGGPVPPRSRHDSSTLLMLPAPLAINSQAPASRGLTPALSSSSTVGRTSEDTVQLQTGYQYGYGGGSDYSGASQARLIPSPAGADSYESPSSPSYETASPTPGRLSSYDPPALGNSGMVSPRPLSTVAPNANDPFSTPGQQIYDEPAGYLSGQGSEESSMVSPPVPPPHTPSPLPPRSQSRGVTLTDSGPVPGPERVRRVSRAQARRSSTTTGQHQHQQPQPQNRYSRGSQAFGLPPGAAPPQHGGSGHGA